MNAPKKFVYPTEGNNIQVSECRGARASRLSAAGLSCRRRRCQSGGCREDWHTCISESVFTVLFIGTLQKTIVLNVHAHVLGRALWHALAQTET